LLQCIKHKLNDSTNALIFSLLQQDIAVVADEAARKYKEETRLEDLTDGGPTTAMLEAVKGKTHNLVSRLSKLTTVANPALGSEFLEEVLIRATQ
jgi:hypothetical protein